MEKTSAVAPLPERIALAQQILAAKQQMAAVMTEEFLERHPDWLIRYGPAARSRGIEDAAYHIDFLAAAIESGSMTAFCDYARWCGRLLSGLGIAAHFLAENLRQIPKTFAHVMTPSEIAVITEFTESAVAACLETPCRSEAATCSPYGGARALFVRAILAGRRREALTVVRETLRQVHSVPAVYLRLFQDALYELGHLWETGQITVAQEHMATATVQYVVAQIYSELPLAPQTRGNALVTGVQGEFHQVGANLVADMLEMDGWSVRFLGTNMPHRGIVAAVEAGAIDLLGISATMLFNLPKVRSLVEEIRTTLGDRAPRIVVGGGAFRLCPQFCHEMGVDGPAADVMAAVRLCAA